MYTTHYSIDSQASVCTVLIAATTAGVERGGDMAQ
jgi:hypothetical protein